MTMQRSMLSAGRNAGAGLAAILAVVLAGCASSHPPSASAPAPVSAPRPGSPGQAQALAQHLLDSLVFPAGATVVAGPVPASLAHEGEGPIVADQAANLHRVYRVPGGMNAAFTFLKAHVPGSIGSVGSGQTTEHGTLASDEITGQETRVPDGIYLAAMAETVVAGPNGSALVLADAEVIWHPARSAAEYLVARHFRRLVVVATPTSGSKKSVRRVLTSQAAIGQVVNLLNSLQAAPRVPPGNLLPPATYQLDFEPAGAAQAAQVGDGGVLTETVVAGGASQPALWDPPNALAALVDRLTGLKFS
jgi:hypothetical protein